MRAVNDWRVALRIARRGALRTRGRSLLVVLLIAVPVLGLAAGAVLLPSTQSTLAEREHYSLGSTQAKLTVVGGPKDRIVQGVEGGYDYEASGDSSDPERVDPRTVLPTGTRTITVTTDSLVFASPTGLLSIAVEAGPSWNPALEGPYELLSGRRPAADDEVLLSPAALARLGTRLGGTITTDGVDARTLRVVGAARDADRPDSAAVVFGTSDLLPGTATDSAATWVVDTPLDAALVARLNAAGTTVFSREFVLHPSAQAVRYDSGGGGLNAATVTIVALALVFAVFEVALLAGAAFLVGARQQQRLLAVVASTGAERSVLRRVVTANGVVLGAVGGVLGVGLGIGAAAVVMRWTSDGSWTRYPGLHLWWPLLAGIAVFGVLVGWIAALVPARAAARFDIVRALRGARTPQKVGRRPVLGVVLLAAGLVAVLLSGGVLFAAVQAKDEGSRDPLTYGAIALLGGGSVVAQVGVLLCAGLMLRAVAHALHRAPLATRLAARDTSRNLGRAVPAVASVMTTVFIAAFAMCIGNTASIYSASTYFWTSAVPGQASASVPTRGTGAPTRADAHAAVALLERDMPVAAITVTGVTQQGTDGQTMPSDRARDAQPWLAVPALPASCTDAQERTARDLRCGGFTMNGGHLSQGSQQLTVGPASGLALILGHAPSAAALASLRSGGAVALRSDLSPGGSTTVEWFTPKQFATGDPSQLTPVRTTRLRSVIDLPVHVLQTSLYVTPETATRMHAAFALDTVAMSFTRAPTQAELDSANTAIGAIANSPGGEFIHVETGPQDYGVQIAWWVVLGCLVIAIAAAATAIGLARVDGRADDLTLSALGASRRIRRTTGAVQALIVCGLGAGIGTLLGLLPPLAIGQASASYAFAPPVLQLVLIAVGIPVVIALGAWLFAGRSGDLTRRTAIT